MRVQRLQLALQSLSRTQRGPWLFTKLLFEISDIKNVSVVTVLSLRLHFFLAVRQFRVCTHVTERYGDENDDDTMTAGADSPANRTLECADLKPHVHTQARSFLLIRLPFLII